MTRIAYLVSEYAAPSHTFVRREIAALRRRGLTILPFTFGALGILYVISATVLGALFLWDVVRVMRRKEWIPAAWHLYKFSLLYLALLFAAMVLDRVILS